MSTFDLTAAALSTIHDAKNRSINLVVVLAERNKSLTDEVKKYDNSYPLF